MEMLTKLKEKIKALNLSKKQMGVIAAGATVVVCGGIYGVSTLATSNNDVRANTGVTMAGASAYMEETVSTGDIVVGISETATASMYQEEVGYDFVVEVEEFYVKAGEDVVEGQALALLDMDTVNEEMDALALEIADAVTALAEAEADYDIKEIQAEKTLSQTIYYGENADYLYSVALTEIDDKYEELEETKDERAVTLYYAYVSQGNGVDTTDLDAAKVTLEDADEALTAMAEDLGVSTSATFSSTSNAEKYYYKFSEDKYDFKSYSEGEDDDGELVAPSGYSETSELLEPLQLAYDSAQTNYNIKQTSYDTALVALDTAVSNALSNYSDANDAYEAYGNEIEYYQIEAYADYQTNLSNYTAAYDVYDNTMAMNENSVETAEQTLEQLQTEYEAYDELPADGIVLATCSGYVMRLAEEDVSYNAGTALVTIGSDQSVEIWVSISQDDIADISIGMETNVIFDAYEEYTIPAVVESISTSSSSGMTSTVNYTLEISCDISAYPELVIFDSMSATVTFVQRQESGVLMVSSKCITTEDGVSYVKMLDDNGDIMMVEVETGFSDGFDVEIVSGLQEGDVVIIESAVG